MNTERDKEICQRYIEGQTLREIGEKYGLSLERVRQVLRKANIFQKDRKFTRSDRDEFLGVNLTKADKARLKEIAANRGVSMSALTADMIREMLQAEGKEL